MSGIMKLLAAFQQDDIEAHLAINVPSAGYYTNIRFQCINSVVSQNQLHFWMGTNYDKEVMDAINDAVEMTVIPDLGVNAVYKSWSSSQDDPDGVVKLGATFHFGKKRIYIDDDDMLKIYTKNFVDAANDMMWLVTADFVPKKGAIFRLKKTINGLTVTDDFRHAPYTVPIYLENVVLEVTYQGDTTEAEGQGQVHVTIFDEDDEKLNVSSLGGSVAGDIFDANRTINVQEYATGEVMTLDFNFTIGASNSVKEVVAIPLLRQGQSIATDLVILDGVDPVGDLYIELTGIVKYQGKSNDANFLVGSELQNLNDDAHLGSIF